MSTTELNPGGYGYFNVVENGSAKQSYVIDPATSGASPFGTVMELENYAGPGSSNPPTAPLVKPSSTGQDVNVVGVLVFGQDPAGIRSVAPGKVGQLIVDGLCQVLCDATTTAGQPLIASPTTAGCAQTTASPAVRTIGLCLQSVTISSGTKLVWAYVNPGSQSYGSGGGGGGVTSFNTRTGAVTLSGSDVSTAGGMLGADNLAVGTGGVSDAGSSRFNLAIPALSAVAAAATANVNIAAPGASLDGYTLLTNDEVLLPAQSTPSQNGVWIWNGAASPLTRPNEYPSGGVVKRGRMLQVVNGSVLADTVWLLNSTAAGITIDTTAQTWVALAITGSAANEAIIRANSLNQFAAATGNYPMGGNTLTGVAAAVATGQPLIFDQLPTGDAAGTISVTGTDPPIVASTGLWKTTTASDGEIQQVVKDGSTSGDTAVKGFKTAGDSQPQWAVGSPSALFGLPGLLTGPGVSTALDTTFVRTSAGIWSLSQALSVAGLTGTVVPPRWVGGTNSGTPATGATSLFLPNDWYVAGAGRVWVCSPISGTAGTITGATNSGTTVTYTAANNLIVGQTVSVTGITGFTTNNPNGTWVVTAATASTFQVVVASAPTGSYASGGVAGVWGIAGQATTQVIATVTGPPNTAAVPTNKDITNVVNGSAAALQITLGLTTPTPQPKQKLIVAIYDFSGVAQTLTWVNTENSTISVPGTSNGSTTLPLTVGFQYNASTSKWRCIGVA